MVAPSDGLVEPDKCLVFITKPGVNERDPVRSNVFLARHLFVTVHTNTVTDVKTFSLDGVAYRLGQLGKSFRTNYSMYRKNKNQDVSYTAAQNSERIKCRLARSSSYSAGKSGMGPDIRSKSILML